jgi:hypothetical protein
MAHLLHELHIDVPVDRLDPIVKDPRNWPTFWVGMGEPERVFGDGSPGTKAEFTQLMMGMRLHMVDRTVEERHNSDGSTDWRWQFEGTMSGEISCHHQPADKGTDVRTTFDYTIPGSVLGKFADRVFLEKRVRRDFEDSMDNLKLFAETSALPAAERKTA